MCVFCGQSVRVDAVKQARTKRDERIRFALREGYSLRTIARAFGLSPARIAGIKRSFE